MGHVKTTPQVDQNGQQSGQLLIEIIYGGLEAPFGGLDTSAPPAYIDPKCLASTDGFLVVDNKLVLSTLRLATLPVLWGDAHPTPLKFGTYYDSNKGQLNYALGFKVTAPIGPPLYWIYEFFLTIWDTVGNVVDDVTLSTKLWQGALTPTKATLTLPVIMGETATYTDSGTVGIDYGSSGVLTGTVTTNYVPGMKVADIVTALVAAINASGAAATMVASPTSDGLGITLTAVTAGVAGNALCIGDDSGSGTPGITPAFYLPIPNELVGWTFLSGGTDLTYQSSPIAFPNVSATAVGGTLYFANLGSFILKYINPGQFDISSMYAGVTVIRKFAGSLIGLGTIPQLGVSLQNAKMIFSWSGANNLDEWSPVRADGNVTGAGFAQLADIDDALTGLIVSNNTAFILRSQGISYASITGSGSTPFQFAHIGLGQIGEGAQNSALIAQYDQTGAYVGNAEIFQISGSISPIGGKINSLLFSDLQSFQWPNQPAPIGAEIVASTIGGDNYPLLVFMLGQHLYAYNTFNQTWMFLSNSAGIDINAFLGIFATKPAATNIQVTFNATIVYFYLAPFYEVVAYSLIEGMDTVTTSNMPQLTFPQEELMLGRDVTIDALYIALYAKVTGVVTLNFLFNGVLFAVKTLDPAVFNTLNGNPVELKIFPTAVQVFTAHSPQLQIQVVLGAAAVITGLRFTKIIEFATFDPNQRPV